MSNQRGTDRFPSLSKKGDEDFLMFCETFVQFVGISVCRQLILFFFCEGLLSHPFSCVLFYFIGKLSKFGKEMYAGAMENTGSSENLIASRDSLASVDFVCKKKEKDEYVVYLDVSKAAVVQRMMKWEGLKPVSFVFGTKSYCNYF